MTYPVMFEAILVMLVSCVAGVLGAAVAKFMGGGLPPVEIAFLRMLAGVLALGMAWHALTDLRRLPASGWFALRCTLGIIAIYAMMRAFTSRESLALVSLIIFSRVAMMPVTARLLIGEPIDRGVWPAVGLGAIGVVIAAYPSLSIDMNTGAAWALLAAVCSAGSQTAVRRLTRDHGDGAIVLGYMTVASVALGVSMVAAPDVVGAWVTPTAGVWAMAVALGGLAIMAQWAATHAFRLAPVGWVAPLDFMAIPIAGMVDVALVRIAPVWEQWWGVPVAAALPSFHTAVAAVPIFLSVVWIGRHGASLPVRGGETVGGASA